MRGQQCTAWRPVPSLRVLPAPLLLPLLAHLNPFFPFLLCLPCPPQVRTHLRNMIIIPEMIGSVVGVYNGKTFNQVGISLYFTC